MSNLYEAWVNINEAFLTTQAEQKVVAAAGVYVSRTRVSLYATGFGVPDDSVLLRDERVALLRDRYVDPVVWEQCYERFRRQPKGASHTFLFNRKGDRPKAGGCLLSIVLCKTGKNYEVMVTSRAIESTMAMLADIAFVRSCLEQINTDLDIGMDLETTEISWHIGVMHQNRVFVPVYIFDVHGAAGFRRWLRRVPRNRWESICIEHSTRMVEGNGVTGARALWGKRLKEWCFADRSDKG